jgi:NADH:ubiquinone oxidoreductase subunit E
MIKITVCIGSSCHIKGSRQVVEQLQDLIAENNLGDKVDLGGTFCMGKCQQGVCVTVNDDFHSVTPETVGEFFANEVLAKVK